MTDHALYASGELMIMFDEQGDKLKRLIDNMVSSLQLKFVDTTIVCSVYSVPERASVTIILSYTLPHPLGPPLLTFLLTTKNHMYFSGGLGGSSYLIKLMEKEYKGSGTLYGARIHASSDPQLCVCKGLVMNRLERLRSGSCTFSKLCARTSLGILKYEKLRLLKASHRRAKRENDGHNVSKQQIITAVDWVVLKVSESAIMFQMVPK